MDPFFDSSSTLLDLGQKFDAVSFSASSFSNEPAPCPVNDWWIPDFLEDWGNVLDLGDNNGPYAQYWTDGYTWCVYGESDNLLGQFVLANGASPDLVFHFSGTNGEASGGVNVGPVGVSRASNDSTGFGYDVNLVQAPGN